ncbi:MAG: type III-B CRISPR module RAMP protein Cmr1 [Bacillota bacterium]
MEVKFECEVLTPLFLGGADPRLNPELRASSVRGALRYWFRALVGGSNLISYRSVDEIERLNREEEQVFGSTERGSPVSVIVIPEAKPAIVQFQKERTGKDYLFWSMAASGPRENPARYQPAREYIQPGTRFQVKLRTHFHGGALKKAVVALWLLANLGALGARANRGAGSIQATVEQDIPGVPAFKVCRTIDELEAFLTEGVCQCLAAVTGVDGCWRRFENPPLHDVLSPDGAEIWLVADDKAGWQTYAAALNGIGERLRDYRSHRRRVGRADHDAVLEWLQRGGEGPLIRRAAFGLPLPFRYSQGRPGDVIQSTISARRGSPLKIRVTRLATGRYVGVLTLFKSRFIPEKERLKLQTRKWMAPPPKDYKIIEEFIQTFPVKWGVLYA